MGAHIPEISKTEQLAMAQCKILAAMECTAFSKERKKLMAEARELSEPLTPQVEDNHDDE